LSTNAYFIPDGSIWGYGWATYLQDALANNGAGSHGATISTYGDFANSDGYAGSATSGTPSQQAAALNYDLNGGPVQMLPRVLMLFIRITLVVWPWLTRG